MRVWGRRALIDPSLTDIGRDCGAHRRLGAAFRNEATYDGWLNPG